jgi:3-hydroxyisobutyrate dehydrogenase-like beta-hydroxyacid dehydrogenase
MRHVHFIGVGKMGLPMALHLHAAGHAVRVSDAHAERRALAHARGLAVAGGFGPAEAACDTVFSSLPDDAALLQVAADVARSARTGTVYVDTSTVSVQASAEAARLLQAAGVLYLRSTVSGNNHMAEAAQLTVMASGPRAAYDAALPLLALLGPQRFYLGRGEEARLMKLVVNHLIVQTSAMLAEALTLGRKGGLDWEAMWQVLAASAVASPILKAKAVQLAERDFTPTFTVEQMQKDVGLILQAGAAHQVPLPLAALAAQSLQAAAAQGDAALDYAAILRTAERSAGLDPGTRP